MGVNVIYLVRIHRRPFCGNFHRSSNRQSVRLRCGHVVGIAGETVAGQFTVDLRTSSLRVFVLLQNKNTASFTHHKAAPIAIKWARGVLRFIVAGTHCAHGTETTDSEIVDYCLAAAGKKHLSFVFSDHSPTFTDRVTPRSTPPAPP